MPGPKGSDLGRPKHWRNVGWAAPTDARAQLRAVEPARRQRRPHGSDRQSWRGDVPRSSCGVTSGTGKAAGTGRAALEGRAPVRPLPGPGHSPRSRRLRTGARACPTGACYAMNDPAAVAFARARVPARAVRWRKPQAWEPPPSRGRARLPVDVARRIDCPVEPPHWRRHAPPPERPFSSQRYRLRTPSWAVAGPALPERLGQGRVQNLLDLSARAAVGPLRPTAVSFPRQAGSVGRRCPRLPQAVEAAGRFQPARVHLERGRRCLGGAGGMPPQAVPEPDGEACHASGASLAGRPRPEEGGARPAQSAAKQ
jgi:hypothetical protein